jgi:hypothetical protein
MILRAAILQQWGTDVELHLSGCVWPTATGRMVVLSHHFCFMKLRIIVSAAKLYKAQHSSLTVRLTGTLNPNGVLRWLAGECQCYH